MSNIVEYAAKSGGNGGQAWSEEEQRAYDAKWKLFAKRMANRPLKGTRNFVGQIIEIGEAHIVANTFPGAAPGATRTVRTIKAEITEPGLEGLRFIKDSADNLRNEKTMLYAAYVAVEGETPPPPFKPFRYDLDNLLNKPIQLVIAKGNVREDGKRGGIQANLVGIEPVYRDEDEDEVDTRATPPKAYQPPATQVPGEPTRYPAAKPQPQVATPAADEDDETPWD